MRERSRGSWRMRRTVPVRVGCRSGSRGWGCSEDCSGLGKPWEACHPCGMVTAHWAVLHVQGCLAQTCLGSASSPMHLVRAACLNRPSACRSWQHHWHPLLLQDHEHSAVAAQFRPHCMSPAGWHAVLPECQPSGPAGLRNSFHAPGPEPCVVSADFSLTASMPQSPPCEVNRLSRPDPHLHKAPASVVTQGRQDQQLGMVVHHQRTRCVSAMEKFWDGERCWGVKPGAGGPWGVAEGGSGGNGPGGSFAGGACSQGQRHCSAWQSACSKGRAECRAGAGRPRLSSPAPTGHWHPQLAELQHAASHCMCSVGGTSRVAAVQQHAVGTRVAWPRSNPAPLALCIACLGPGPSQDARGMPASCKPTATRLAEAGRAGSAISQHCLAGLRQS